MEKGSSFEKCGGISETILIGSLPVVARDGIVV